MDEEKKGKSGMFNQNLYVGSGGGVEENKAFEAARNIIQKGKEKGRRQARVGTISLTLKNREKAAADITARAGALGLKVPEYVSLLISATAGDAATRDRAEQTLSNCHDINYNVKPTNPAMIVLYIKHQSAEAFREQSKALGLPMASFLVTLVNYDISKNCNGGESDRTPQE